MSEALPGGWSKMTFGDIFSHRKMPGQPEDDLLSVTAKKGVIRQSESGRRDISSGDKGSYNRVLPGDVVYNTMRMWQGVSGVSGFPGIVSPAYTVCVPNGLVDADFLSYLLKHPSYVNKFRRMSQGLVSDTWNLKFSQLAQLEVILPPLSEQRRIAEVLDAVDECISASVDCIEKLSLARDGLVSGMLSGVQGSSRMPLVGLAEVASGVTLGGALVGSGSSFPCITVANVQDGYLDLEDVKEILLPASAVTRYLLRSGDFLMTEGGDFDKLGRGAVWQGEIEDCMYQNHIFRIRCDQSRLLPEFLSIYSASWYGKSYFRLASKQSTNLASINSTQVKNFPVPMISLEEQRRIVSIVQAHDERIAAEKARLEKLRKLKAGLMDDLLTGRVRVNQLDELPV